MYNHYREPSIDVSFQLLVNFGQRISEEKILSFYKLTNQKQEVPMAAMVVDTRRVPLVEQKLLTPPQHLSSPSFFMF
jgi:hypothetical protein